MPMIQHEKGGSQFDTKQRIKFEVIGTPVLCGAIEEGSYSNSKG